MIGTIAPRIPAWVEVAPNSFARPTHRCGCALLRRARPNWLPGQFHPSCPRQPDTRRGPPSPRLRSFGRRAVARPDRPANSGALLHEVAIGNHASHLDYATQLQLAPATRLDGGLPCRRKARHGFPNRFHQRRHGLFALFQVPTDCCCSCSNACFASPENRFDSSVARPRRAP